MRALLVDKEEDRFTEFLGALLQDRQVLAAFLAQICSLQITPAERSQLRVGTQIVLPQGRPDLVVRGPRTFILFEAKMSSWLHDDQIVPYAKVLSDFAKQVPDGTARLFLLTPSRTGSDQLAMAGEQLKQTKFPAKWLRAVSWDAVGRFCRLQGGEAADVRLRIHLQGFADLIQERLRYEDRPLSSTEVALLSDRAVAIALLYVQHLVVDVVAQLGQLLGTPFSAQRARTGLYQGFTLRYRRRWWWFGTWLLPWAEGTPSPLVLQLPSLTIPSFEQVPSALRRAEALDAPHSPGIIMPIPLRGAVERSELVDDIASLIASWLTRQTSSGGVGASPMSANQP